MKHITLKEFENNLDYYLELTKEDDVCVMDNDDIVTVLINPDKQRLLLIDELARSLGKVDENIDYDRVLKETICEQYKDMF